MGDGEAEAEEAEPMGSGAAVLGGGGLLICTECLTSSFLSLRVASAQDVTKDFRPIVTKGTTEKTFAAGTEGGRSPTGVSAAKEP